MLSFIKHSVLEGLETMRWVFAKEKLPPSIRLHPQKLGTFSLHWVFSGEVLEEKPVVKRDQKNFLKWLLEKEPL
ncbi:MAG: hypothetical protein Q8P84_07125 [Deltaproteobacteria bacterium]|nr:hypothetical protein [Deltaproteobacteria bacterium]